MKNLYLYLLFIVGFTLTSCAKVYQSPDALALSARHKVIAIMPPNVSLPIQKNTTASQMADLTIAESENLQQEMVAWMLRRSIQKKISIKIQDGTTTKALLAKQDIDPKKMTPKELATLLEVDAVLISYFKMRKPMSTGGAVVTTILFGFGTTNEANVVMELHDAAQGKLIWNLQHTVSGGLLTSADRLVDELMRVASKKLPYFKK